MLVVIGYAGNLVLLLHAYISPLQTENSAHPLPLLHWEEEMGAAQRELGAAALCSNLSGGRGGPFQGVTV